MLSLRLGIPISTRASLLTWPGKQQIMLARFPTHQVAATAPISWPCFEPPTNTRHTNKVRGRRTHRACTISVAGWEVRLRCRAVKTQAKVHVCDRLSALFADEGTCRTESTPSPVSSARSMRVRHAVVYDPMTAQIDLDCTCAYAYLWAPDNELISMFDVASTVGPVSHHAACRHAPGVVSPVYACSRLSS